MFMQIENFFMNRPTRETKLEQGCVSSLPVIVDVLVHFYTQFFTFPTHARVFQEIRVLLE